MHGYIRVFSNAAVVRVFSTRQRVMGYPHVFSKTAVFFFLVTRFPSSLCKRMYEYSHVLNRATVEKLHSVFHDGSDCSDPSDFIA